MINTIASRRWVPIIALVLTLSLAVFIGILTPRVNVLIPLVLALVIPSGVFVVRDLTNFASYQKPSMVLPLLMVSLPFYNLFLVWRGDLLWQCISLSVFVTYFFSQSKQDRRSTWERAKPLSGPIALLLMVSTFPVIFSEQISRDVLFNWFIFASGVIYWLLACLYCRSVQDIYRLIIFLLIGALFQFPIFVGQALGWTSGLPGGLAKLSPDIWGGSLISAGRGVRYPGSFGDVELIAEYLGIIFLFGAGIFLTLRKNKWKIALLIALTLVVGMGVMTGTRGFLFMSILGTVILLYGNYRYSGKFFSNLVNVIVLVSVVTLLIWFFLPEVVRITLMERLTYDQIFQTGNAMNRESLFSAWLYLLPDMPIWGFGNNLWSAINAVSPFVVQSPHSLYFSMLLMYGYLGLFAIILLILNSLIILLKLVFKRVPSDFVNWILLAILVSWTADQVKIEFLRYQFYIDFIFLLFGLITCAYTLSRKHTRARISRGT